MLKLFVGQRRESLVEAADDEFPQAECGRAEKFLICCALVRHFYPLSSNGMNVEVLMPPERAGCGESRRASLAAMAALAAKGRRSAAGMEASCPPRLR